MAGPPAVGLGDAREGCHSAGSRGCTPSTGAAGTVIAQCVPIRLALVHMADTPHRVDQIQSLPVAHSLRAGDRTEIESCAAVFAVVVPQTVRQHGLPSHEVYTMTEPDINLLRLDRPGIRAVLGDLEAEIMEAVWRRPAGDGVTVREVWVEIYPKRAIMYTTVMNTMARLARKGLLATERKEPAYIYRAILSRDEFIDRFVGEALEQLLANFGGVAHAHLRVDDPALKARLAQLLDGIERRRAAEEPD